MKVVWYLLCSRNGFLSRNILNRNILVKKTDEYKDKFFLRDGLTHSKFAKLYLGLVVWCGIRERAAWWADPGGKNSPWEQVTGEFYYTALLLSAGLLSWFMDGLATRMRFWTGNSRKQLFIKRFGESDIKFLAINIPGDPINSLEHITSPYSFHPYTWSQK